MNPPKHLYAYHISPVIQGPGFGNQKNTSLYDRVFRKASDSTVS